jgi:predicted negative regulator of RcsB-dependent stress response
VSYQTEEQQVEQLKEWWKENGTPLIVGAVIGLSGFFGWKYWTEQQIAYQSNASNLYSLVTEELEKEDATATDKKVKLAEGALAVKTQFPESSYAILSAFHLAKLAVDEKNLDKAVKELTWVIDTHSSNELVHIAKIRLARILVAQQKAEQALPFLSFESESGYFEIASLIKGDAMMALGKSAEALEAYKAADNAGKVTARHQTLKLKIANLTADNVNIDTSSDSKSDVSNTTDTDTKSEIKKVNDEVSE